MRKATEMKPAELHSLPQKLSQCYLLTYLSNFFCSKWKYVWYFLAKGCWQKEIQRSKKGTSNCINDDHMGVMASKEVHYRYNIQLLLERLLNKSHYIFDLWKLHYENTKKQGNFQMRQMSIYFNLAVWQFKWFQENVK